jgi:hypothetical protein
MGKRSKRIEASSGNRFRSCEAHYVGISPQEDRGGATGKAGESQGAAEEGGVKVGARMRPAA